MLIDNPGEVSDPKLGLPPGNEYVYITIGVFFFYL